MEGCTYFYDFRINEKNLGYFEIRFEKNQIYQNVKFQDGDEVYENPFYLKLDSGKLVAFKKADRDWVPTQRYGENHFPSSAYPILLAQVTQRLEYFQINEASEEVEGIVILERTGTVINEYHNQELRRGLLFAILKQAGLSIEDIRPHL